MVLLTNVPDSARQHLEELKGSALVVLFEIFYWVRCLKACIMNFEDEFHLQVLRGIRSSLSEAMQMPVTLSADNPKKEDLVEEVLVIYKLSTEDVMFSVFLVYYTTQAWSFMKSDKVGRVGVGTVFDILFVKNFPHVASFPFLKYFWQIGFQ